MVAAVFSLSRPAPAATTLGPDEQVAAMRQSLAAWIKADTSNPPGNEDRITKLIALRLRAAGVKYEVIPFAPGRSNIVARLAGPVGGPLKPLLLLAHIDVVGTQDQTWSSPPHHLTEVGGYLVGRGISDDLGMGAVNLEVFLALKAGKKTLTRDVILAFTGDEESGGAGVRYLLDQRSAVINAGIALNEGASTVTDAGGKVRYVGMQTAEKSYADFIVEAKGPTGHSSVPLPGTAIYALAEGLTKISKVEMPAHLLPVTQTHFARRAALESGPLQTAMEQVAQATQLPLPAAALAELEKDPIIKADLRTTCVATLISGGTKENALPPSAAATINCRILPDESVAEVQKRLTDALAGSDVQVRVRHDYGKGFTSPVDGEVPKALALVTAKLYPGAPVLPVMSRGATDSRYLRQKGIDAYGIQPLPSTDEDGRRAHGIDERLPVASLKPGLEFMTRLVDELAVSKS